MTKLYMLQRSATGKFDKVKPSPILLKRFESKPEPVVKKAKLIDYAVVKSCRMTDDLLDYCEIKVKDDGLYSISTQLCLKQTGKSNVPVDFVQYGVCEDCDIECGHFQSVLINDEVEKDYMITQNLTVMMELKANKSYNCWLQLSCANPDKFEFMSNYSSCKVFEQ